MTSISSCGIVDGAKRATPASCTRAIPDESYRDLKSAKRGTAREIDGETQKTDKCHRRTRTTVGRRSLVGATAVLPLDVFGSGSRARVAFKFPSCCCCDRQATSREASRSSQGRIPPLSFDSSLEREPARDGAKREPF